MAAGLRNSDKAFAEPLAERHDLDMRISA